MRNRRAGFRGPSSKVSRRSVGRSRAHRASASWSQSHSFPPPVPNAMCTGYGSHTTSEREPSCGRCAIRQRVLGAHLSGLASSLWQDLAVKLPVSGQPAGVPCSLSLTILPTASSADVNMTRRPRWRRCAPAHSVVVRSGGPVAIDVARSVHTLTEAPNVHGRWVRYQIRACQVARYACDARSRACCELLISPAHAARCADPARAACRQNFRRGHTT